MQRISRLGHNRGEVVGPRSRDEFQRSLKITPGGSMRAAPFFAPHPPYAVSVRVAGSPTRTAGRSSTAKTISSRSFTAMPFRR